MSDRTVRVWDRETGEERIVLRGHAGRVSAVGFAPSGDMLISGSEQPGEAKLWDLTRDPEQARFSAPADFGAEALAFDPTGIRLFAAFPGGEFDIIDQTTRRRIALAGDVTKVWLTPGTIATFSDDGRVFASVTGQEAKHVRTWTVAAGAEPGDLTERAVIPELPERVYQVALSADGRRLASATIGQPGPGRTRVIRVHDAVNGALLRELPPQLVPGPRHYGGLRLSPDGTLLAYDDYEPTAAGTPPKALIRLLDLESGRIRRGFRGHEGIATALAFARDGRVLASAEKGRILLWDLETGRRLHDRPLEGPTFQLAFSPDGRRLAGVDRQEVKLWDVRTGRDVLLLRGASYRSADPGINPQVAWSRDGLRLAASNHDLSLSVWDASMLDESPATTRADD
jgi:WD40 repeat protein